MTRASVLLCKDKGFERGRFKSAPRGIEEHWSSSLYACEPVSYLYHIHLLRFFSNERPLQRNGCGVDIHPPRVEPHAFDVIPSAHQAICYADISDIQCASQPK